MNTYTIYCTEGQIKKALELGAPIQQWHGFEEDAFTHLPTGAIMNNGTILFIPTAEQVMGWLRTKGFKFLLSDDPDCEEDNNWWVGINGELITQGCDDNKELAAIDAVLEYLITCENEK